MSDSRKLTVVASADIDPVVDPLAPFPTADIETVFRKPAERFGRNRARKRRYAKDFPHPFERGLWSAKAVADWLSERRQGGVRGSHVSTRATDSLCPFSLWILAEQP